jgi:hypothetical protein
MSQNLPVINSVVQQFGIEFCECTTVLPKMYYVEFKTSFLYSLNT